MSRFSTSNSTVNQGSSFQSNRFHLLPALILALTVVVSLVLVGSSSSDVGHPFPQENTTSTKQIKLRKNTDLPILFTATDDLNHVLQQNSAEPLALASGDFDQDGVADLIVGYKDANRGILTLLRGNVDSVFPNSLEAQMRKSHGEFTDSPFLSSANVFSVPEAPEFITTGDFDSDGHLDVVTAARDSQTLYLLTGDGLGQISAAKRIELAGKVTAMSSTERNEALVVGINSIAGPKLLVFKLSEGLLNSKPEIFALPEDAKTIAFGKLDDDGQTDLLVATEQTLLIVNYYFEQLTNDKANRELLSSAKSIHLSFPAKIKSVVIGQFLARGINDIALLTADGSVSVLSKKKNNGQVKIKSASEWSQVVIAQSDNLKASHLIRGRMSTSSTDELILVEPAKHRLQILTDNSQDASPQTTFTTTMHARDAVSFDLDNEPVALLPMRLDADALDDLVILRKNQSLPLTVVTQTAMTYTVTNTNDSGAGSLRQAILDANANPGADTINFNIPGTAPHTIILTTPLPAITESVTINGTSQPDFSGSPVVEINGINAGAVDGLTINAGNSVVRGLVINRFNGNGIVVNGSNNFIEGNFIGTSAAGTFALSNTLDGVLINGGSNNTIGGTTVAARNLLSGNRNGIQISGAGSGNIIRGNFIGTNVTGTVAIGNSLNGILINGSSNNAVGAVGSASSNVIAFNGSAGVAVTSGTGNSILSNSIFLNGGLGIDLGPIGVTPNDSGDPDTGANNLQNFPVITSASNAGVSTAVEGTFNSTQNTSFRLEFFSNQVSNPSGFGEGQSLIGAINVTTDATGNASFSQTFQVTVAPGQAITSTATRNSAPLDTSEFSRAVQVGGITGGQPADLSVLTSISPNPVQTFSTITQSIIVSNAGPGTATNVTVTDLLPSSLTFASCDASAGGVCGGTGNSRTITFASLAPGTTALITIVARVNCNVANGVPISVTAVVFSSTTADPNTINNSATATTTSSNPAPTLSCPGDLAQPNDPGKCSAVVNFQIPLAFDNCPSTSVVCSPAPGSNFDIGTTRVTCTATDTGGGTATCSFNVTVLDTEPARLTCPSNITINAVPGQCSPVVTYTSPTVSDNCPGTTVACVPPSGSTFPLGSTVVNCIATSSRGGQFVCSFNVTVNGAPQAVIKIEGNGTALEFGPISAKGKSRKLKKQPVRNFTIENTGCLPIILSLDSIMRTGNDVDRGRISNPDDRGLFSLTLVESTGVETPVEVLMDIRIAPGEKKNFRVRFNPIIPTVERGTSNLAAVQVLPDLITSKIVFTQNAGPPIIIKLVGQISTDVQLIDPDNPRRGALIVFSRVQDEFIIEYSIYDSNLDVSQATYQFFDKQGRPAGRPISVNLTPLIQSSGFVRGQSFTIRQELTGAKDHPEIVGVTVEVSDSESSASANSDPSASLLSNAIVQWFQQTESSKLYLPLLKLPTLQTAQPLNIKNDALTKGASGTQRQKELE
jgi:uncharacterized repeat protein (TIGR01451 family)